ncbi:MAG TPA: hypothetical protein PLM56_16880 [Cyclobacteriaceae bacterium]|jgi:hypothetical protein|nr:hypothetical protein [Cytophagales bacterium]HMR58722.1 hypothetical protein [Cyclobacteriaceae bacterium]HNT50619.1 hypothetical protein [Cyclobacteriaceae bacterium]HRE66625.1 hypothetical protein [Cyclobacteriaceae bacterium]HRF35183.1 hypothetical protein [Cyclobacteriaceae bacterium]
MRLIFGILFVQFLIYGCTTKPETKVENAIPPEADTTTQQDTGAMLEVGDSILLPAFEIEVTLSDAAQKKISYDKETIIVKAYLSGQPKDSAAIEVSEMGLLFLAEAQVELEGAGVARFDKVKLSKEAYEALADKDFEVLINIYSGRRSSEYNILNADLLQEPISRVTGERHALHAKLIGE